METTNQNRKIAAEMTIAGIDLYNTGDVHGALKLYLKAWSELDPVGPADGLAALNVGVALEHLGDMDGAFTWARTAFELNPQDSRIRTFWGAVNIRSGNWLEAWKHWFPVIENSFTGGGEEWKPGMDLTGKEVLVVPAGGMGDIFMLARYVPEVAKRFNCKVTFALTEDMVGAFITQPSMANVNFRELRKFDVWMHLFHFPLLFQFTPEMVAADFHPYIQPIEMEGWEQDDIRIGIKLGAGEKGDAFKFRSVTGFAGEHLLGEIGSRKSVTLVALTQSNKLVHGWLDTIALVSTCDLVLSADTATLHLAGAMGKPAWALLGDFCDSKYGLGETMPWYPTMRIFRGQGKGYQYTVEQVIEAFDAWLLNSGGLKCHVATT